MGKEKKKKKEVGVTQLPFWKKQILSITNAKDGILSDLPDRLRMAHVLIGYLLSISPPDQVIRLESHMEILVTTVHYWGE